MQFSEEQRKAINNCDSNIYMAAGPGSGKSTTLAEIARRLHSVEENKIILITFTNKSAKDILGKVGLENSTRITGGTFHSTAFRLMKESGVKSSICDENKKRLIIKKIFDCRKDKDKFLEIYDKISRTKSMYPRPTCEITQKYNEELYKYDMMDFDDIIYNGIEFVRSGKSNIIATHILVDELQDTSGAQLELLKVLITSTNAKILGVGDLDQSIYEWRGARPANVREFINHFGCTVYQLGLNFRSTQKIVEHSKQLISFNKDRIEKNLRAYSNDRGSVLSIKCADVQKEIDYIISYCKRNRDKEIGILYRTRLNKMKIEFELRKLGIKYNVNDSTDIVDRSAFRVLLGMLRMACGIYDIYDLDEVSKGMKALGKSAVEKVRIAQNNTKIAAHGEQIDLFEKTVTTFDDLVHNLYHSNKGIRKSLGNILKIQSKFKELKGESMNQLVRLLPSYCTPSFDIPEDILTFLCDITEEYSLTTSNIRELCNDFGLDKDNEKEDDKDALIELSTIHGYKGGERDIIILPFCDWDFRPDDKVKNIWESERRLFYVAITRSKTKLILTYSGNIRPQFIKEMGL